MTLSPEWLHWIKTNLDRNCTSESIVDAMVRDNFDTVFASVAVQHVAAERASPTTVGAPAHAGAVPRPYASDGSRVASGNAFQIDERLIRVAFRMQTPDLIVLDGVLSGDECDALIERSQSKLLRSTTVDPATGAPIVEPRRTSEGTFFQIAEDPFIAAIDRRLAQLLNWPLENAEGLQILHYGTGGEYKPHYDYFPPEDPGSAVHMQQGGQRVATLIMYLNDVEDGGETIFPNIDLSVCPRKGSAVYFGYANRAGQVDPLTYHGGAPVKRGEKWIATRWLRERAYGMIPEAVD